MVTLVNGTVEPVPRGRATGFRRRAPIRLAVLPFHGGRSRDHCTTSSSARRGVGGNAAALFGAQPSLSNIWGYPVAPHISSRTAARVSGISRGSVIGQGVSPIASRSAVSRWSPRWRALAMLSYAEDLFVGVLAGYEAVADIDALASGIELAVARLVVISKQRRKIRGRRGLSLVVNV